MKTIQLELSNEAFKAIKKALNVKDLSDTMKPLDYAWLKVLEHIEDDKPTVALKNKANQ